MRRRASHASRRRSRQDAGHALAPAARASLAPAAAAIAILSTIAVLAFAPVLKNGLVNWDDPFTLQNNPHLAFPALFAWAFTTLDMGHYQPLAWLAWGATKAVFGLSPRAFHALSLLGHLVNGLLVYFAIVMLAGPASVDRRVARTAAILGALAFLIHPMRVEVVAWASAFPYILGLALVLTSLLAYITYTKQRRLLWWSISFGAFALSLMSRANALTFPIVLLVLDAYPLGRTKGGSRANWKQLLLEKAPFGLVAAAAAVVESQARDLSTLTDVGVVERLTIATAAPFSYLAHTLVPYRLTPVDAMPLAPQTNAWLLPAAAGAFVLVTVAAWMARRRWPAAAAGWFAYVLLLAPVAGLTPSGQQATADRYMYLPGVVVAVVLGAAIAAAAGLLHRQRWVPIAIATVWLAAMGASTLYQVMWWRDSITLWTRVLDLDSTNDLASYNLAVALADAGRTDEAIARYDQTLRLVPDQRLARENRDRLLVQRDVGDGDRSLESGRLDEAIDAYSRALAMNPHLTRARSGRGIALARRGRIQDAIGDLQGAFDETSDPGVADALAFALSESGRFREAVDVLERALAKHGDNAELAGNLARLFATAPDPAVRNPAQALRLALAIRDHTGVADPRVLDTLAAAYAGTGQRELARQTAEEAVNLARQQGNVSLANQIALDARAYGR